MRELIKNFLLNHPRINNVLGKITCFVTRKHRQPLVVARYYPTELEFCGRCGKIIKRTKIGRTFREILEDEYSKSNQIW